MLATLLALLGKHGRKGVQVTMEEADGTSRGCTVLAADASGVALDSGAGGPLLVPWASIRSLQVNSEQ
jgi:hypothetical protein